MSSCAMSFIAEGPWCGHMVLEFCIFLLTTLGSSQFFLNIDLVFEPKCLQLHAVIGLHYTCILYIQVKQIFHCCNFRIPPDTPVNCGYGFLTAFFSWPASRRTLSGHLLQIILMAAVRQIVQMGLCASRNTRSILRGLNALFYWNLVIASSHQHANITIQKTNSQADTIRETISQVDTTQKTISKADTVQKQTRYWKLLWFILKNRVNLNAPSIWKLGLANLGQTVSFITQRI